jgi:hypothetical protein
MDFSFEAYRKLLTALQKSDLNPTTFISYFENPTENAAIIRHDVDRRPLHGLKFGELEKEMGITATYYFRAGSCCYNEKIIKALSDMGHEIGYHYENLGQMNGNYEKAITDFENNLSRFRKLVDIKTICMHGLPMSPYDNKDLWQKYDYRDYDIQAEPFIDIDYRHLLYITDASRTWRQDSKANLRDKVANAISHPYLNIYDIIKDIEQQSIHQPLMFNIHPHNWSFHFLQHVQLLAWQSAKNMVKSIINRVRR